jgi:hypothetical protein
VISPTDLLRPSPAPPLQTSQAFVINFPISLICDKIATTQNLTFLSYWYRKKLLAGIVSQCSAQNSPLDSSCVIVALIKNYSTSKYLKVSTEKS